MADFKYESICRISTHNIIDPTAVLDSYIRIGAFNVIEARCRIHANVDMENHITLKELTVVDRGTRIENGVQTSGHCSIGQDCVVKQGAIIGRQVYIGDRVFISPNVVFLYANHKQQWEGKQTTVEEDVFIGSGCQIMPGVRIAKGIVIGAGSVVTKDLDTENGVYVGSPAKFVRMK